MISSNLFNRAKRCKTASMFLSKIFSSCCSGVKDVYRKTASGKSRTKTKLPFSSKIKEILVFAANKYLPNSNDDLEKVVTNLITTKCYNYNHLFSRLKDGQLYTSDLCKAEKLNEDDVDYLNEFSIYTSNNVQDCLLKFEQLDAKIKANKEKTKNEEPKMTKNEEAKDKDNTNFVYL